MSEKTLDHQGRWRSHTIAFRISPEENEDLNARVRMSGLTKQDYIIRRVQCRDVIVQGNPRVYKARSIIIPEAFMLLIPTRSVHT